MTIRLIIFLFFTVGTSVAQDNTRQHLSKLSLNEKLVFLDTELRSNFYSDPSSMVPLLVIFDSLIEVHDIDTLKAVAINFHGNAFFAKGSYAAALEKYLEAKSLIDEDETSDLHLPLYNNLAACYRFTKELDRAITYFELALDHAEKINDSAAIAQVSNNLGMQFLEVEQYDKAKPYLDNAIEVYDQLNSPIYKGISLLTRANLNNAINAYQPAINDYNQAMELVPETMAPIVHAASYAGIGAVYRKTKRYKSAEKYLKESLVKANKINHTEQIKESNRELSELYDEQGDCNRSMFHYKEFVAAKDSLFTTEQYQRLTDAISKYEAEKRIQEIALLTEKQKTSTLQLKAARRGNILLGGGLGMLGLLSLGLYYFWRQIRDKNKIISKGLQEKEILLKEIHHRVKNNLHFISALLGLQTDHVSDQVALDALQEGQDRVQSMALIHQDLYQRDDLTSVNMKQYFIKLIEGLFDSYNIRSESISLKLDIAELNLDVDSVIPIGLIVNELVSNSLKYAFEGNTKGIIEVSLKEANNQLQLSVADDGIGMNDNATENLGDSLGYKLIKALTEQLEGSMSIDNADGTKVSLSFTKYQKSVLED